MNPIGAPQNKFEQSPYAIVTSIGEYVDMRKKVQEMVFTPPRRRRLPKIPIATVFPSVTTIVGKIGSGKSTRVKRFAEQFLEEGRCVLDLNDHGGFENACYALPNRSKEVWENFNSVLSAVGRPPINFQGKEYPTICYVPATRGLPKRLPDFFQPFRIVWQTLEFSEFITLCGFQSTDVAVELLDLAWTSRPKGERFEDFIKRAIKMSAYGKLNVTIEGDLTMGVPTAERRSFPPLLRKLKTLWDLGIICNEGDKLALDLHAIMMDNKHIHSFSVGYIADRIDVPFLIYGYLLRRVYNLRKNPDTHYPKMSMMIREAQKLAPYVIEYEGQTISRACLRAIGRECRHLNLWVYMDTQDQIQLDFDLRRKTFTWYIYLSDKLVVDLLRKLFYIPDTVAYAIPKLPIGFCAVYHKTYMGVPSIYLPPLSHVKRYDEKFMELWQTAHNGKRWKVWDIDYPDSNDVISFSIPSDSERANDVTSKSAKRLINKYILFLVGLLKKYKSIGVKEFIQMISVEETYFDTSIRFNEEFKRQIKVENGIATLKEEVAQTSPVVTNLR
jgi:hypothetical protein